MCWYSLKWNSGWIIQSVVTIFYEGSSMQIFFELTSFSSSVFCSFRLLSLFLLRKTFLSFVHFVAIWLQKKRNVQSPLFLDTYPGGSPSSRVKITRDVCVRGGGRGGAIGGHSLRYGQLRGYLRVILTGNLQTSQALPVSAYHKTSGYQSFDLGDGPRQSTESRALWTL